MNKCWVGAEYIISGDGHLVVLETLKHYMAKLESIQSPEYGATNMFIGLVKQEAAKRTPQVEMTLDKVHRFLIGESTAQSLIDDIPIINSAIDSYRFDLVQSQSKTEDEVVTATIARLDEAKQAINKFE